MRPTAFSTTALIVILCRLAAAGITVENYTVACVATPMTLLECLSKDAKVALRKLAYYSPADSRCSDVLHKLQPSLPELAECCKYHQNDKLEKKYNLPNQILHQLLPDLYSSCHLSEMQCFHRRPWSLKEITMNNQLLYYGYVRIDYSCIKESGIVRFQQTTEAQTNQAFLLHIASDNTTPGGSCMIATDDCNTTIRTTLVDVVAFPPCSLVFFGGTRKVTMSCADKRMASNSTLLFSSTWNYVVITLTMSGMSEPNQKQLLLLEVTASSGSNVTVFCGSKKPLPDSVLCRTTTQTTSTTLSKATTPASSLASNSNKSSGTTEETNNETPTNYPLKIIQILLGVAGGLILLLVTVVFIYYIRRKRCSNKQIPVRHPQANVFPLHTQGVVSSFGSDITYMRDIVLYRTFNENSTLDDEKLKRKPAVNNPERTKSGDYDDILRDESRLQTNKQSSQHSSTHEHIPMTSGAMTINISKTRWVLEGGPDFDLSYQATNAINDILQEENDNQQTTDEVDSLYAKVSKPKLDKN